MYVRPRPRFRPRNAGGVPFSPALLFTSGVAGAWYDPSDVLLNWRTNLLTYSEQFDNAAWLVTGLNRSINTQTAPDSTVTADTITGTSSGNAVLYTLNPYTAVAGNLTLSWYIKAGTADYAVLSLWQGGGTSGVNLWVNVQTGAVGSNSVTAGFTFVSGSSTAVGNGWYRVVLTGTVPAGAVYFSLRLVDGDNAFSYTNTVGKTLFVWGAQLELGSTATTYQAITTPEQTYLLYDPQPVLYQDSAGTTPVTAVEQPVGLMLDKSQGLVLGSELVTNGDFSGGTTGWTLQTNVSVASGQLVFASTSSTLGARQDINVIAGRRYQITYTIVSISVGALATRIGGTTQDVQRTSAGTYTESVEAVGSGLQSFGLIARGTTTAVVDNISVKEIPGNHARQATPTSCPVLRARYNLLTYSEQFDNAAWTKSNSFVQTNLLTYSVLVGAVAGTPGTAPTGWSFGVAGGTTAVNASSISLSATTGNRHFISNPVSLSANTTYTVSLNVNAVSGSSSDAVVFVLVTAGSIASGTILLLVSDGTGRKTLTFTTGGTATTISLRIGPGCSGAVTSNGAIDFDSPQLVQGAVPGDYRATSATALPILYTSPIGTLTAMKLCEDAANSQHYWSQPIAVTAGVVYTVSFRAKAAEKTQIVLTWATGGAAFNAGSATFNLSAGTVTSSGAATGTITSLDSGWYLCTTTNTCVTTNAASPQYWSFTGLTTYAGDGTSGIYIWGADLRTGSSAGTYQRIAAATDYVTAGFLPYLAGDGTDDNMVIPATAISGATAMTEMHAAWRPAGFGAGNGAVFGGTGTATTNDHEPFSDGALYYGFASSARQAFGSLGTVTTPYILDATQTGTTLAAYRNGTQLSTTATVSIGIGANPRLFVSNNSTLQYYQGNFFGGLMIKKVLSAAETSAARSWFAAKAGITL